MKQFSNALMTWYVEHKRELPWRETRDPYRVWISEIILQQTRVVQGHDYFLRFMERFPTLQSLSESLVDDVLKLWQGLGYYSRARNLHQAACSMAGVFPTTYAEVRALKGVGDYTAAAICSLAFGLPYAVVDGNVYRVLARYFGIEDPIDSTSGKKIFAQLAQQQLEIALTLSPSSVFSSPAGDYNQAIMDFGALQCTPSAPRCAECPLCESCTAFAERRVAELPVKARRTKVTEMYLHYIYVRANACTYIKQRTENGIWQGLYEFPLIETSKHTSPEEVLDSPEFKAFFVSIENLKRSVFRVVATDVKHLLSHRTLHVNLYEVQLDKDDVSSFSTYQRILEKEFEQYAVSKLIATLYKKIK
ncbi:MAG: A/G-specific adenine glycosylase [Bacteroidaceae bacterium]|nr:A/G-specific adenine glycosylase [Bacteroidaceae bacterium]